MFGISKELRPMIMPPSIWMRVLILDDCEFDRARMRRFCDTSEHPMHVQEVNSLHAFRDAVAFQNYDVYVIDYNLTDGSGLDALNILNASRTVNSPTVVMVTGSDDEIIEALGTCGVPVLAKSKLANGRFTKILKSAERAQMCPDTPCKALTKRAAPASMWPQWQRRVAFH